MTVLEQAQELIHGERQKDYGEPKVNFERIAKGWSVIFGQEVTPVQVCLAMDWLKTARLIESPNHRDSWLDKAGYIGIGADRL